MCSGITFLVGLFLLIKGSYRVNNRDVPRDTGRIVGLILMAPLIVGFIYGFAVVNRSGGFSEDLLMDETLLNAACVEMGVLLLALSIAGYLVFSLPQTVTTTIGAPVPQRYSAVMTPAEVAHYLRIPEFEVIVLIEEGKLPAARIGGEYRIARSAVDDFLNNQTA